MGICVFTYCKGIAGLNIPLIASAGPFPVWLVFYVMGVAEAQLRLKHIKINQSIIAALFAILLCMAEMIGLKQFGHMVPGIKVSAHLYSFFVIHIIFSQETQQRYRTMRESRWRNFVLQLGKYSFYIYLTHFLFIREFTRFHLPDVWILKWCVCVALSYISARISDVAFPARLKRFIGL